MRKKKKISAKKFKLSRESGEEDQAHLLDREPTQLVLCLRFATDLKGESWLRAEPSMTRKPQLQSYTIRVWSSSSG
jgi:hypothetical protein